MDGYVFRLFDKIVRGEATLEEWATLNNLCSEATTLADALSNNFVLLEKEIEILEEKVDFEGWYDVR